MFSNVLFEADEWRIGEKTVVHVSQRERIEINVALVLCLVVMIFVTPPSFELSRALYDSNHQIHKNDGGFGRFCRLSPKITL